MITTRSMALFNSFIYTVHQSESSDLDLLLVVQKLGLRERPVILPGLLLDDLSLSLSLSLSLYFRLSTVQLVSL
jgi:hypothetical protein